MFKIANNFCCAIVHVTTEGFEMLGHGMKSVDYGGGSIEDLDLSGSRRIINKGEHL